MITFIIPNYDKPELTLRSVEALFKHSPDARCVVVDDGSPSQERLGEMLAERQHDSGFTGWVQYVPLIKNGGFSVACNAGIKAADGSHVVLLNNDCEITSDAVKIIERVFAGKPDVGIIGALLRYPDGKIQHDGMDYRPQVGGAFVHGHGAQPRTSRYYASVTGALFAIRREVIDKIGMLDESLFAACEDSDYCIRAGKAGFMVWYESTLTATHAEGATRGRTVNEKKERLGIEKFKREVETVKAFRVKHSDAVISCLDSAAKLKNIRLGIMNLPDIKIELGCGDNPQPGYIACDARKVRGVKHVFDMSNQRFPFSDGSIGEILMNHSIEHVSYRKLPHLLKECRRVLAVGGKLIIRTPDLKFIVHRYLDGDTTPEWPGDENFIAEQFGGDARSISPCWWANVKLFAGQDYPGNEHRFCFDFETLSDVLSRYGFRDIERTYDKPVFSPGEIYCEAVRV